jgi:3-hydroxybutyryl-CoA dehydrogenase
MDIKKVAVVGGGTMGSGIAHTFALSGFDVTLIEADKAYADKALKGIGANMDRQVAKSVITADQKAAALARIRTELAVEKAAEADLVVEAVPEVFALKKDVFTRLDASCKASAILASNTSSLPITSIAAATKRADKVIGMHFMNPVPVMKLVELIRGLATSDETYKTVHELALKLGKTPACSKDFPGFLSNRILMPMINEAVYCLMEGVGTREDIDTTMKLGMAHPMGPLTLADFIGIDVCVAIMDVLYEGFKDSKYRCCPLLRQMAQSGRLGRKSGKGFYDY